LDGGEYLEEIIGGLRGSPMNTLKSAAMSGQRQQRRV